MERKAVVFGLEQYQKIAEQVSKRAKIELGESYIHFFADGETFVQADTSVRGKEIFIIASTKKPVNDNLMELLLFIDAVKRASSGEINVIIPYYGYSRQDRKTQGRQAISAKLVAKLLEVSGANRIITFDIHSEQSQGFFEIPVDILRASGIIAKELKKLKISNAVIVTPDHGGLLRARRLAFNLGDSFPIAVVDKRRTGPNRAESMFILGDVKDKNIIIIDDIIDTGGTILSAIDRLKEAGAKDFYVVATHGVFSTLPNQKTPQEKLFAKGVKKIIITNSIIPEHKYPNQIVIDLSDAIAGVINAHLKDESITSYYIKHFSTQL